MNKAGVYRLSDWIAYFNKQWLRVNGLSYHLSPDAPDSWAKLVKYTGSKDLPIYDGASTDCIYRYDRRNHDGRAVHDYHHIAEAAPFTPEGERRAILSQWSHLTQWLQRQGIHGHLLNQISRLFLIDTLGQVDYYFKHKAFVSNQMAFALEGMR